MATLFATWVETGLLRLSDSFGSIALAAALAVFFMMPTPAVAQVEDSQTPGIATPLTSPLPPTRDRDCGDFTSWRAAQTFFEQAGPGDPHGLDRDRDGVACEGLR
jgi:hypothetical protein